MKILFLTNRVPYPPTKGEKIRSYHEIDQLIRRHEVHLVTLAEPRVDDEPLAYLKTRCASVEAVDHSRHATGALALGALVSGRPFSVAAFDSAPLKRAVERRIREERPDLLFAYSCAVAPSFEASRGIPRVIDFVDADSEKYRAYSRVHGFPQSLLYALEADRLGRYEGRLAATFDASLFVAEPEAAIVRGRAPGREMTVLPNGVDLDTFRPAPESERAPEPNIVFTGVMGYYPNVDAVAYFARDVMPHVRAAVPAARFLIVGRDPVPAVRKLEELPGVVVTGTVPDVRPYLADAALAVAPFRIARGVQNKVLEAMACALPVVGTSMAFQGLGAREGDGVRMADTPEAMGAAVASLLRDETERRAAGRRARDYVERHHHWDRFGERLDTLLTSLVDAAGGRR
ncbi:MAG TPA: TIGR03087 family PEP-CTERM/XrtA system glycosyltransferase [Candidatus Eisenbacteria bacterium]|nr:TIGR03087 family PEP-CTERM/XrtA system glycosyltransferase [Candidatus Eisenbacteria bacterium]